MDEVLSQIAKRTMGDPQLEAGLAAPAHFGTATYANVEALGWGFTGLCLLIAAILLLTTIRRYRHATQTVRDFLLVASPALLPLVWFELLRNHSIVHSWFVFRSFGMSLGVVVAAALFVFLDARRSHSLHPVTADIEGAILVA
jgi:hypothetical protein